MDWLHIHIIHLPLLHKKNHPPGLRSPRTSCLLSSFLLSTTSPPPSKKDILYPPVPYTSSPQLNSCTHHNVNILINLISSRSAHSREGPTPGQNNCFVPFQFFRSPTTALSSSNPSPSPVTFILIQSLTLSCASTNAVRLGGLSHSCTGWKPLTCL